VVRVMVGIGKGVCGGRLLGRGSGGSGVQVGVVVREGKGVCWGMPVGVGVGVDVGVVVGVGVGIGGGCMWGKAYRYNGVGMGWGRTPSHAYRTPTFD
jgi:hypothetical protein